jgi:DNA-binding FadR family transcriptional regulator
MEMVTLALIESEQQPVGAARLAEAWRDAGLPGAEATAGRFLRELDGRGLTRLHRTTKGRVLTDQGKESLQRLVQQRRLDEHGAKLWSAVNSTDIADLIDLLYVRRAVETESARLAAMRATDDELDALAAAAATHVPEATLGHETTTPSMKFHRMVAEASHNRILIAVGMLLLDPINDRLEKILEYIARDSGLTLYQVSDHEKLAEALKRRDVDSAELIMRHHIDTLIQSVESYQDRTT